MTHHKIVVITLGAAILSLPAIAPSVGARQSSSGAKTATATDSSRPSPSATPGTTARTADGQPNLQGRWVNFDSTPFEAAAESSVGAAGTGGAPAQTTPTGTTAAAGGRGGGGGGGGAGLFADRAPLVPRRRSMVVEPPSGIVPVMPWAEQKRAYDAAHINDSWEHSTPWERCITRGIPGGMFPTNYDNAYEIVQSPGFVTIVYEMIHKARAIPVDGRPHLPANIRLWDGDSRGHWEGNTLVVDITNYNDKGTIATNMFAGRIRGIPQSEALHVIERFTRVSENTINYEAIIDDPKVYTAPWKVAMPLTRDETYEMYEYSCHEENRLYMETTLGAGRVQEKKAGSVPDGK